MFYKPQIVRNTSRTHLPVKVWLISLITVVIIATVESDQSNYVCLEMAPQNSEDPLSGDSSPFAIDFNPKTIPSGSMTRVRLSATSADITILGVMVEARRHDSDDKTALGQFQVPSGDPYEQTEDCGDGFKNVVFVVDGKDPHREVLLDWIAPDDFVGEIVFHATAAKTELIYWVGILSRVLRVTELPQ